MRIVDCTKSALDLKHLNNSLSLSNFLIFPIRH